MDDWSKLILKVNNNIIDAIKIIDREKPRIALVSDDDGSLIGTVTDGDVRRGLIRKLSMDSSVEKVMNKSPKYTIEGEGLDVTLARMSKYELRHLPILNNEGIICGLKTIEETENSGVLDNPVLIMAGGFGRRLLPLTKNVPKPMLKIGDKPILEMIFEKLVNSGFRRFYFSTHYKSEIVSEYFGNGERWGVDLQYIHEVKQLGTAGSIGLMPGGSENLPFLVMNGDLLTNVNFRELIEYHNSKNALATVCAREYSYEIPHGIIENDGLKVKNISEKPVKRYLVNAGIYVFDSLVRNMVSRNEYLDMPELLNKCVKNDDRVYLFGLYEYWRDIGRINEFNQALEDIDEII